ncbi:MAG: type I-E CRISPR-associated protein Cas6/Cse3/CasE [Methylomicrobium sp.]|nr:type I-E CRISPR-associated protein Cas6/Cse3/CasE [Methylomicrobium sp.]PPD24021.1 MAG: type I-E CRISPR-associated protein Cas6/Cse3/CasE [Methylobacter sp.]
MSDMYAAVLRLSRNDVKTLKVTDAYSLHRVVYDLFDDIRSTQQKQTSIPSGILYADKGGDFTSRQILMLANRPPNPAPDYGQVESKVIGDAFLHYPRYAFEVIVNPGKRDKQTGKIVAVRGREAITAWFIDHAEKSWGFKVNPINLQIEKMAVQTFKKDSQTVTHGSATLKGELHVTDRDQFRQSFRQGIGRGRAFGFGLLQIVPLAPL